MERHVGPADCVLAIALPMTWAEFATEGAALDRDFVKSMIDGSGRTMRQAWDEVYEPRVVRTCERVADRVREYGSTVAFGATAIMLRELLEDFPVVCLVAHSVFMPIDPADLIDPEAVLRIVLAGESLVARHLRARLDGKATISDLGGASGLAMFLQSALESTRHWFASTARRDDRDPSEPVVNRVMLEDCFAPAMRRGRVLELRDRMHTMDDLVAAIPMNFQGVLELCVCNSVALGESIKRQRRDCLVIENSYLARVDLRLARYALVMRMLADRPNRYTDALCDLSLELMKG